MVQILPLRFQLGKCVARDQILAGTGALRVSLLRHACSDASTISERLFGFWSFRSQETSWHVLVAVCGICSLPLSDLSLHMCIPMRTCGICVFIEATFSAAWRCVRVVRCASVGVVVWKSCVVEELPRRGQADRRTDRQRRTATERQDTSAQKDRQTEQHAERDTT